MGAGTGNRTAFTQGAAPPSQITYSDSGIYIINPDGSGRKQVLTFGQDPTWSPGGDQIAFSDGTGIKKIKADGSGVTALTGSTYHVKPNWSMSGNNLIVFEDDNGDPDDYFHSTIDSVNSDGTGLTRLTFDGNEDITPALSPDGTTLAYLSSSGLGYHIFITGQQVTFDSSGYPDWSPDGRKIAYAHSGSDTNGGWVIAVMNADGSGQLNLTTGSPGVYDLRPTWCSMQKIVFASNRTSSSGYQIYMMDATGANQTQISNTVLANPTPACSRCPRFDN